MHGSLPGLAAGRFGVIMFFSACRLPSFAPEDPPSHASGHQITTGSDECCISSRGGHALPSLAVSRHAGKWPACRERAN